MFIIEPLVAKMLLPLLGGTSSVWNTCVVFYQCVLLAGYLYAHLINLKIQAKIQAAIHLAVLWMPVVTLPITAPTKLSLEQHPYLWLFFTLAVLIGGVFFALSTTAPLLQKWYSKSNGPGASDPYFLYAASNTGAMLGLLSYPFFIEPAIGLKSQSQLLSVIYVIYAVLSSVCALLFAFRSKKDAQSSQPVEAVDEKPVLKKDYLYWLFYSMLPSSLVLGITTYVTNELSAIPLFWIVPLSIYILTFIIAFSRFNQSSLGLLSVITFVCLVLLAAMRSNLMYEFTHMKQFVDQLATTFISFHLLCLFLASLTCNAKVACSRPSPRYLTHYYLCIALGGMLGSIFNSLIAPLIFTDFAEYPLVLAITAAALFCGFSIGKIRVPQRAIPYVVTAAGLGILWQCHLHRDPRDVLSKRNFYGQVRVGVDLRSVESNLYNGITLHGSQSLDPERRKIPLSYYSMAGPVKSLMQSLNEWKTHKKNFGVIGIGTGSLLAYAGKGQSAWLFDINPEVVKIASNPFYFTYIYSARKKDVDVKILLGDGRLEIQKAPDKFFSLLILDAYSSDAIPTHLITQEAIKLYSSKMVDGGVIAFHISNTYYDIKPVLSKLADSLNLEVVATNDFEDKEMPGVDQSEWVVITSNKSLAQNLKDKYKWKTVPVIRNIRLWTDDYCDPLGILIMPFS